MTQKRNKFAHKPTAAQLQFKDFVEYITALFLGSDFAKSYMTPAETRNRWRAECNYKPAAVEFLIDKSKAYLHLLSEQSPNATNPQFLEALVKLMADYLSAYTMRGGGTRKHAKEELTKVLFLENSHIKFLTKEQAEKRQEKRTPQTVAARRKRDAALAAKQARELHRQVMGEFAEARTYVRKG